MCIINKIRAFSISVHHLFKISSCLVLWLMIYGFVFYGFDSVSISVITTSLWFDTYMGCIKAKASSTNHNKVERILPVEAKRRRKCSFQSWSQGVQWNSSTNLLLIFSVFQFCYGFFSLLFFYLFVVLIVVGLWLW